MQGPTNWHGSYVNYFNLLDRCLVQEQINDHRDLHLDTVKAVVLPAQKDWDVIKDVDDFKGRNWDKIKAPGALTWYKRHGARSGGYWMLERAERTTCSWKHKGSPHYTFTYMYMVFPPYIMWEEAMVFDFTDVDEDNFADLNLNIPGGTDHTVTVIMPNRNLTVVIPPGPNYQLHGTGYNNFTIVLPDTPETEGRAKLFSKGGDRWIISAKDIKPSQLEVPAGASSFRLGVNNKLELSNFTTNLTVVDRSDRLHVYFVDPVNGNYTEKTITPADFHLEDTHDRATLHDEYKHPNSHSLNRVQRFQPLEDGNWLDEEPETKLGLNMMIPTYFDGVIQKDRIFPAGLYGEIFKASAGNSFRQLSNVLDRMATAPDATFVGTLIDYHKHSCLPWGHFFHDYCQNPNFLGYFLEHDGNSLEGDIAYDENVDNLAFRLSGYIQLEAGRHQFRVGSDDGFRLRIDNQEIASYNYGRRFDYTDAHFDAEFSGLYNIEFIYWEGVGNHRFHTEIDNYTLNATRLFNEVKPPNIEASFPEFTQVSGLYGEIYKAPDGTTFEQLSDVLISISYT